MLVPSVTRLKLELIPFDRPITTDGTAVLKDFESLDWDQRCLRVFATEVLRHLPEEHVVPSSWGSCSTASSIAVSAAAP